MGLGQVYPFLQGLGEQARGQWRQGFPVDKNLRFLSQGPSQSRTQIYC